MELKDRLLKFATVMGWKLAEKEWIADALIGGLTERERKFGVPICPCVFFDPSELTHLETIAHHTCPCPSAFEDVNTKGRCHCGLFEKKEI